MKISGTLSDFGTVRISTDPLHRSSCVSSHTNVALLNPHFALALNQSAIYGSLHVCGVHFRAIGASRVEYFSVGKVSTANLVTKVLAFARERGGGAATSIYPA